MSKLPITAVTVDFHPGQSFIMIGIGRGTKHGKSGGETFKKWHSYHISDWRHTRQQAQRAIRRARRMQDILLEKIQFKENDNDRI